MLSGNDDTATVHLPTKVAKNEFRCARQSAAFYFHFCLISLVNIVNVCLFFCIEFCRIYVKI